MFGIFTLLYVVLNAVYITEAMRCFECTDIPHLEDCDVVRLCNTHEICYVEQIVTASGHVTYNSGCKAREICKTLTERSVAFPANGTQSSEQTSAVVKRSGVDLTTCEQCCSAEFCNNQGCGQTATPKDQRGLYCYSCQKQKSPDACRYVKQCEHNEVCLIDKLLDVTEIVYDSHCIARSQCESIKQVYNTPTIGKRSPEVVNALGHISPARELTHEFNGFASLSKRDIHKVHLCILCCDSDFCNNMCIRNIKRTNSYISNNSK
ncbi:uncharacterized protein LOC132750382 [Ruditapes philippinarum]|uniref:uncharacterized protein LOC132750382 n=1 Tax=Ruditapes philippinarum TaxID=129788 RepID=UPI00295B1FFA|nr:uncharacterized protein LOC132750382 [Ruditapes philippinarum]